MQYKEWEQLDDLLSKEGFGGYYDLVECIKDPLRKLATDLGHSEEVINAISDINTIKKAINELYKLSEVEHPKLSTTGSERC